MAEEESAPEVVELTEGELAYIWRRELAIAFSVWIAQTAEFKAQARELSKIDTAELVSVSLATILDRCGLELEEIASTLTDEDIRSGLHMEGGYL